MIIKKNNFFFSLITFILVSLSISYTIESFLFFKSKKVKDIKHDKWSSYNMEKEKFEDLKPYVNSMYSLNHSSEFPKIFSSSTFSNSNIFTCNENSYYPIIKSDRYGFFNDDEIWEKTFDMVFVGDSFTAGSCVGIKDNIISNFNKNFKKKKIVLNLGSPGSFPLLELIKPLILAFDNTFLLFGLTDGMGKISKKKNLINIFIKSITNHLGNILS